MIPISFTRLILPVFAVVLCGCQNLPLSSQVNADIEALQPFGLATVNEDSPVTRIHDWTGDFNDPMLSTWIEHAVGNNFSLEEARYRVEAAKQQHIASRGALFPTLGLSLDGSRRKDNEPPTSYSESYQAGLDIRWEVDLWGGNYASFKAQDLLLQAEQATLQASRLSLAGQVASAWYQVVTSSLLTDLFSKRVDNLATNLEIINNGYRQGINAALDVYLARNNLASEQSNLSAQRENQREAVRQLQLLLGEYPTGTLAELNAGSLQLPEPRDLATLTLTTDSVRLRYDLQASFLNLAAQDRQLAAAHRARFPSLTLVASSGDSASDIDELFDGSSLAWNIIGSVTQPLFYGGQLQAQERRQLALLRQAEQRYLQALNVAFAEIEQTLTNDGALDNQLQALNSARIDAEAAAELAFDNYRQGLVTYTEVLEAQRRAFAAQSSLLNVRNQRLQNRINMYLALGADYQTAP